MSTVLKVENLWKQYRLGVISHGALMLDLQSWWARFRGREDPNTTIGSRQVTNIAHGRIWALRDVSFEIKHGEVVGIIGRNGAGKSTLLKIISRVTAPTRGNIKIKGRVTSLLEVGMGFHAELTGRENIFLNGAILGMSYKEIKQKFDAIVDFSGVEAFIDTPVKRYSSGMYVRLAFAVAAHLDPEILVVDEVLAVGDEAFQKKCLGKIGNVANEGRTVMFVSHSLPSIRKLCPNCILLEQGSVASYSTTDETIENYYAIIKKDEKIGAETKVDDPSVRRGTGAIRFTSISVQDENGNEKYRFTMGDTIRFKFSYKVFEELSGLAIYVALKSGLTEEFLTSARHVITSEKLSPGDTGTLFVELPNIYIRPGEYPLYLHISDANPKPTSFDVVDGLTKPLIIKPGKELPGSNFIPSQSVGYFSIPSRAFIGN